MTDVQALPASERLLRAIESDNSASQSIKHQADNHLCLCLIAQEKYDEAMEILLRDRLPITQIDDIRVVFNYAMAKWGESGMPNPKLFHRVVELSKSRDEKGPNYLQCMAMAHFVIGDRDQAEEYRKRALREIRVNPSMIFSAWRYLEASPSEFRQDLEAMKAMFDGTGTQPSFMGRGRDLFSSLH